MLEFKLPVTKENGKGEETYFFLVPDFDPSSPDHWKAVQEKLPAMKHLAGEIATAYYIQHHRFRTYMQPSEGEEIPDIYKPVVVAKHTLREDGSYHFQADPFETGKYKVI